MRLLRWSGSLVVAVVFAAEPVDLKDPVYVALEGLLAHVQGIDIEGRLLWVSSVDRASRRGFLDLFDARTGKRIRHVEVQDGERFHPGGISLDGDAIWVPVAEYKRASTSVIQKRDKRTLALVASFPVADHIGCIAAGHGRLIGGNWDSRELYEWDRTGKQLARVTNPSRTSYQDMKRRGAYLIASGPTGPSAGLVEWLQWPSLRMVRSLRVGKTDRDVRYTNEGMTVRGRRIHFLPEDGPSRLFTFRLP
jgi:hypothetical protein